jgi:hypothetical protein
MDLQQRQLQQLVGSEASKMKSTKVQHQRMLSLSTMQLSLLVLARKADRSTGQSRTVGELAGVMVKAT